MRKVAALAAVMLSLGSLPACSGSDYCGELKRYAESAKGSEASDPKAMEKMLEEGRKVAAAAPDDLKDDWKVLLDYAGKAKDANGDLTRIQELVKEVQGLPAALNAISEHARDSCKVDLDNP
jgi:hypothetical protein